MLATTILLSGPACACSEFESSLRVRLDAALAVVEVRIEAADMVTVAEQQPGQSARVVTQHARGRVIERVYGDWPHGDEVPLEHAVGRTDASSCSGSSSYPLKTGARCYVIQHPGYQQHWDCSETILPFSDTQAELRELSRELTARDAMTSADWTALLAPLTALAQGTTGAEAQGCTQILPITDERIKNREQALLAHRICLHQARTRRSKPEWFIVEDMQSREPRLYAWARADDGATRSWTVELTVSAEGHLILNPDAIETIGCRDLSRRLDAYAHELCPL
ncbi:MAG: hypothetical protein R3F15_17050 [Lysobacterales bacterium]